MCTRGRRLKNPMTALAHLPREARDTLFLLAVIGWVILPQVAHLPIWASALAAGVLVWRGWLAVTARPLPGRWWLIVLLVITLAGTWASHRTLLGRDAGVTLVVMLLTLKTLELRARRDALVVFFLGFFTMLTNFFYSQSLGVAAAMLIGLLGLLTALVNAHRPVGQPSLRESARMAGWMALAGAPVMVALFVLFPRFSPLWGIPSDALTGRSGLSSSMEVGNVAKLALDDGIAMRVKFEGEPPPQRDLYFRGPVLSRFDGRNWTARGGGDGFEAAVGPGPADLQVSGAPIRYEVTLEPSNRPWLLTLDVAADAPELPANQRARMTADMQWLTYRPITDLLRYRAQSHPQFRYGLTGWNNRPRRDFAADLQLPPGFNPRTAALAEQLRQSVGDDPQALVRAALERLRTGGYTYTLEPGVYGNDTADEFWFDRKAGFCEHIASSFVVLMRALNIPARIVTGYQGGELNNVGDFWVLRQSDAHAWTEVWQEGTGWLRVDPTGAVSPSRVGAFERLTARPGFFAGAIGTMSPTLAQNLRAAWDAVNNGWNQWVLNYTQSRQLNLLKNLGFSAPSLQDLATVLIWLLVIVSIGGAGWTLWERSQHDPWLRLLGKARARLQKAGLELPDAAPPRQIAQRVDERFGTAGQPVRDWLLALEAQRYARTPDAQLSRLRADFRRLGWPKA